MTKYGFSWETYYKVIDQMMFANNPSCVRSRSGEIAFRQYLILNSCLENMSKFLAKDVSTFIKSMR